MVAEALCRVSAWLVATLHEIMGTHTRRKGLEADSRLLQRLYRVPLSSIRQGSMVHMAELLFEESNTAQYLQTPQPQQVGYHWSSDLIRKEE
jgi:plasmid replication initiation protein